MATKLISIPLLLILFLTACAPAVVIESQTSVLPSVAASDPAEEMPAPDQFPAAEESATTQGDAALTYPVVDTGQSICYDNNGEMDCTSHLFAGQDAQYTSNQPQYQDNGDGTVTDRVTGLMWQQDPGEKMTVAEAAAGAESFNLAGYDDWRLPTIKELYSLILFDGTDVSACMGTCSAVPFIDTRYFDFSYGDPDSGERVIDSQFASSTLYVSTTMNGAETMFGVNFADGRIKGYPTNKTFYVLYVRGNPQYGQNSFNDNGDGTISDIATGLIWMQSDSGVGMDWEDALGYCESLELAGSSDWRLPNVKELQSIVDYSRAPATTGTAALDPVFEATPIMAETGVQDYGFYWSSTTHADSSGRGMYAAYVSFGSALGYMNNAWVDVHGAGAQRSDPKTGSAADYPTGHGPQGDAIRVQNLVRCVTGGEADAGIEETQEQRPAMKVESSGVQQSGINEQPSQQAPQQPGKDQQPPQEALNACLGSEQGAACQFTVPNGQVSGICRTVESQQLACVPAGQP